MKQKDTNYENVITSLKYFEDKSPEIIQSLYDRLERLKQEKDNTHIKDHITALLNELTLKYTRSPHSEQLKACKTTVNRYAAEIAIGNSEPKDMRVYKQEEEKS